MQDLLAELLWNNEEISEQADRLCESLPGFADARREYEETARKVQDIVGFPLFDQLQQQFLRCTYYEVRAYYALGLGLRKTIFRALCG